MRPRKAKPPAACAGIGFLLKTRELMRFTPPSTKA
jgi:hypothetical protein